MIQSVLTYSLERLREEIIALMQKGRINRQQPIYTLWKYIPPREWLLVERELEDNGFLLRDRIGELVSLEKWEED